MGNAQLINLAQLESEAGASTEQIEQLTALYRRHTVTPYDVPFVVAEALPSKQYQQMFMDTMSRLGPVGDVLLSLVAEHETNGDLKAGALANAIHIVAALSQNTVARVSTADILERLKDGGPILHLVGAMRWLQQKRGTTPFICAPDELGEFLIVAGKLQRFLLEENAQHSIISSVDSLWLLEDGLPLYGTLPEVALIPGMPPATPIH